jgi:hypothetical protein
LLGKYKKEKEIKIYYGLHDIVIRLCESIDDSYFAIILINCSSLYSYKMHIVIIYLSWCDIFIILFIMISGQVVSSEILMASESGCPIEVHHIDIEKCDEMYDKDCQGNKYIPFHRASYDRRTGQSPNSPREQVR